MILARLKSKAFTKLYLRLIKAEIKETTNTMKPLLNEVYSTFGENKINNAIKKIYINGKNIICPVSGNEGQILRALEYGTGKTKALHIISIATRKILKETGNYEFII